MPDSYNAFYAQSGGVTAVINATASGVIETARQHADRISNVYAGRNGIIGALTEDLIDTSFEPPESIAALQHTPGGAFGSCRFKLTGYEESKAEYQRLIEVFKAHNIAFFFYNGGGDSQDTTYKVSQISEKLDYPITCIGIPKTVDNDLPLTDNCPGFGSVAKYVAVSIREAGLDCRGERPRRRERRRSATYHSVPGNSARATALPRQSEGERGTPWLLLYRRL